MGKADDVTKAYMRQNDIFADAFNMYLYQGQQVIRPEQLHRLDTTELIVPYGADRAGMPKQKYRDVFRGVSAMEDGRAAYLLLGIENQRQVHYAAPVKNLIYDALQYGDQVEAAARSHRRAGDYGRRTRGEFLSGFYKEDKLLPVITLMILFSPEAWDGPRSLREMMAAEDERILSLVPDYQLNLLAPSELSGEMLGRFGTSLGSVLTFIKHSRDWGKLREWMEGEGSEVSLGRREMDVLNACVDAGLRMKEEEEDVKMCEALRQMREEAVREVREEKEAAEKAAREAEKTRVLTDLRNIMDTLRLTAEQAMAALKIPEAERQELRRNL